MFKTDLKKKATFLTQGATIKAGILLVALVVLWELGTTILDISVYTLPPPSLVLEALAEKNSVILSNTAITFYETILGWALGTVTAIALAIAIAYSVVARRFFYPIVVIVQSIPKSALAPLFVVWFGFGIESKIVMAAVISFFPVVINTLSGLENIEPDFLDLLGSMSASNRVVFMKIRLPHSLPFMFDGFKVSITLSLIGAIVGEFVAAESGLGYLVLVWGSSLFTEGVFAVLIVLATMSSILYGIVLLSERVMIKWAPKRRKR